MPDTVVKLSPSSRRVLYYLIDNAQIVEGEKRITVHKTEIAKQTKMTVRHVARSLRRLESLGYITTYLQVGDAGDFTASEYVVHPINAPFAEKLLKLHHDQQRVEITPQRMPALVFPKKDR